MYFWSDVVCLILTDLLQSWFFLRVFADRFNGAVRIGSAIIFIALQRMHFETLSLSQSQAVLLLGSESIPRLAFVFFFRYQEIETTSLVRSLWHNSWRLNRQSQFLLLLLLLLLQNKYFADTDSLVFFVLWAEWWIDFFWSGLAEWAIELDLRSL